MLAPETPFPYVGSYCLIEHEGRDQLARILGKRFDPQQGALYLVALPLRADAGGTRLVAESELIDASELTHEECREFHDLDRLIFSRSCSWRRKNKDKIARRDALKRRIVVAPLMRQLLGALRAKEASRRAA